MKTEWMLGMAEIIILLSALRIGSKATITEIREVTSDVMTLPKRQATHHTVLQLEGKSLCRISWRRATGKKGGRSQLEVTVTAKGKRYVKKNLRLLIELANGVDFNGFMVLSN